MSMNAAEARELGERIAIHVEAGEMAEADRLLKPAISTRTKFEMLDRVGAIIGIQPLAAVNKFLDYAAATQTQGVWVIIGSALGKQLDRDMEGAFERCRSFIKAADVWYGTDIMGERVPGPALVDFFEPALDLLLVWRMDPNRWVRRALGVSAHFWAKRSQGAPELAPQAQSLLEALDPMFDEWDMDAVKGVGWGLKTLGKHYPELMVEWMSQQVISNQRRHRKLMMRKALTHVSEEQRIRALRGRSG
jgi:3-methyladenine DNA glycosylase AlkD